MSEESVEGRVPPDPDREAEAAGETVGEAKWTALRELERRFPGLDKSRIEFVVLSEGERGLLGVGFVPARVIARLAGSLPGRGAPEPEASSSTPLSGRGLLLKELLEHICDALAVEASVSVREGDDALVGTFHGRELGLLIGKHGQTIDAIQYLAAASLYRSTDERLDVVVDAAGYRDRRRETLEAVADRTASKAVATGSAIELEPMSPSERKIVHLRLKERDDVTTASEGAEPNRYVVVRPSA